MAKTAKAEPSDEPQLVIVTMTQGYGNYAKDDNIQVVPGLAKSLIDAGVAVPYDEAKDIAKNGPKTESKVLPEPKGEF